MKLDSILFLFVLTRERNKYHINFKIRVRTSQCCSLQTFATIRELN